MCFGVCQSANVVVLNCGHGLCDAHARQCALDANDQMVAGTAQEVLQGMQAPSRADGWGRCPACNTRLTRADEDWLEDRYIT